MKLVRITRPLVNLRAGASLNNKVITTLLEGDILEVVCTTPRWIQTTNGYVKTDLCDVFEQEDDSKTEILITYVDNTKPNWKVDFNKCSKNPGDAYTRERYRSYDTLLYLFRGIEKWAPWVDRVSLIVYDDLQVPDWVNRDTVRIITHDQFIPDSFRPCFNSCGIESFFARIPDLYSKVIYMNDDTFFANTITQDDFFTNGVPNLKFNKYPGEVNQRNMFNRQWLKTLNMVAKCTNTVVDGPIKPTHSILPMTRNDIRDVYIKCHDTITKSYSRFRNGDNVNQYMYSYYAYFNKRYHEYVPSSKYVIFRDGVDNVIKEIQSHRSKQICINDAGLHEDFDMTKMLLTNAFEQEYPDKCKYEKRS